MRVRRQRTRSPSHRSITNYNHDPRPKSPLGLHPRQRRENPVLVNYRSCTGGSTVPFISEQPLRSLGILIDRLIMSGVESTVQQCGNRLPLAVCLLAPLQPCLTHRTMLRCQRSGIACRCWVQFRRTGLSCGMMCKTQAERSSALQANAKKSLTNEAKSEPPNQTA